MGLYLARADLSDRMSEAELVQMTDDVGSGMVDVGVVDEAILGAEAEIDGYVGGRYPLPLAAVPPLLTRLAKDLTVWNLYGRRKLADESVGERYKAAVKLLERIASGQVKLPLPDAAAPAAEVGGAVFVSGPERQFTRDRLQGL